MGGRIKWFGGADKKEKSKPAVAPAPEGSEAGCKPPSEAADVPTKPGNGGTAGFTGPPQEAIVKRTRDLLAAAPPFYPITDALEGRVSEPPHSSDGDLIDEIQGTKLFSLLSDPAILTVKHQCGMHWILSPSRSQTTPMQSRRRQQPASGRRIPTTASCWVHR